MSYSLQDSIEKGDDRRGECIINFCCQKGIIYNVVNFQNEDDEVRIIQRPNKEVVA